MDLPRVVRAFVMEGGECDLTQMTDQDIVIRFIFRALAEKGVQQLEVGAGIIHYSTERQLLVK